LSFSSSFPSSSSLTCKIYSLVIPNFLCLPLLLLLPPSCDDDDDDDDDDTLDNVHYLEFILFARRLGSWPQFVFKKSITFKVTDNLLS